MGNMGAGGIYLISVHSKAKCGCAAVTGLGCEGVDGKVPAIPVYVYTIDVRGKHASGVAFAAEEYCTSRAARLGNDRNKFRSTAAISAQGIKAGSIKYAAFIAAITAFTIIAATAAVILHPATAAGIEYPAAGAADKIGMVGLRMSASV